MTSRQESSRTKKLLAERIRSRRREIESWYAAQAAHAPPPFYCSIDLRDSGYKIAPVDSNLYPAGFNNICPEDIRTSPPILRAEIEKEIAAAGLSGARKVLLVPEAHTRNLNYLENVNSLMGIIRDAGFDCELGWYPKTESGEKSPIELKTASGRELRAFPIQINDGVVSAGEFVPDVVLLNNDFSAGYPSDLDSVKQPILPSYTLGWHSRKKSDHFRHYNALACEFAGILEIDPWILQIATEEIREVDFNHEKGTVEVAACVDRLLREMRESYEKRRIKHEPSVFVKNNAGTYGIGIMTVHSADEILHMNRRTKNKMSIGKNHRQIDSVIVQEGIPTATLVQRLAAEPVIYLVGSSLIGGFLRTNPERGIEENLNAEGMVFRKLCMSDLQRPGVEIFDSEPDDEPLLELVYGSVARISALAAGRELAQHPRPGTHAGISGADSEKGPITSR